MKLREAVAIPPYYRGPPPQGSLLPCNARGVCRVRRTPGGDSARTQFKDPRLWGGVKLVVIHATWSNPCFGEGVAGGPKRLVKA